jgi:DNA-binding transcriptional regulator LsrR (DeoR family)
MKKLTEAQFISAIQTLDISSENIKIARQVLVDGVTQSSIAAQQGITKGRVWQVVNRVREAHGNNTIPNGYQRITVVLPDELAEQIKKLAYKPNN